MNRTKLNLISGLALLKKEVVRFLKVYNQTIIAPAINALLLVLIFSLVFGENRQSSKNIDFNLFISAGVIMMVIIQNSFANTSSSLNLGKVLGSIIDLLVPPMITSVKITAIVTAGILRAMLAGLTTFILLSFVVEMKVESIMICLIYSVLAGSMLSLIGMIAGFIAKNFDQMSAISTYTITPLTFLSGTFYSIKSLPVFWQKVAQFNPFFYAIDGFRYGITGQGESSIAVGISFLLLINAILYMVTYKILSTGYKLKS